MLKRFLEEDLDPTKFIDYFNPAHEARLAKYQRMIDEIDELEALRAIEDQIYIEPTEKRCCRCRVIKSVGEFSPSGNYKDGKRVLHGYCKVCASLRQKESNASIRKREMLALMESDYDSITKRCGTCLKHKKLVEFAKNVHHKYGRRNECKVCVNAKYKEKRLNTNIEVAEDEDGLTRRCFVCLVEQPLIKFPKDRKRKNGRAYRCRSCNQKKYNEDKLKSANI